MPRLPYPGGDDGNWGSILNDYLSQAHNTDGSLKPASVSTASIQNDSIAESKLDQDVRDKLNTIAGQQGATGPTGATGATGPTGATGASGAMGASGASGAQGIAGPTGATGPSGTPGLQGATGATGAASTVPGPTGATGPSGPQGEPGPAATVGATGPSGATGPTGVAGASGAPGEVGASGATGVAGAQGPSGPTGPIGPQGSTGATGVTGASGTPGEAGATGSQGPQGASGPQGLQGFTGPSGPSGPQGPSGDSVLGANWVSVKDHGAAGNSSADDTAAINAAIMAAGIGGTVFFPRASGAYMVSSPIKPLERQMWVGTHSPLYDWDETPAASCAIRAAAGFSGAALIHLDTPSTGRGATFRNLMFIGLGDATGSLNGMDLGPTSGGERAWIIDKCQFMLFGGAAIAGHMWVVDIRDTHISRCGYGIRPASGAGGTSCRANDNRWIGNQIYFTYHHGIAFDGSVESGAVTILGNRIERAGTQVSGSTMDPNANRDQDAAGVYMTRAHGIQLIGNFTDANADSGLKIVAASHGAVNNITMSNNIWKRDGTGDNSATMRAGVSIKDAMYVNIHGDVITYGDPDDGGPGRIAPQYGLELEANDWVTWDGSIQLDTGANTRSNGIRWVGSANWMCRISDARQPVLQLPSASTANAPLNPQTGSAYYDTTLDTLRIYDGAAWDDMGGGGGGDPTWKQWSGSQTEYNAISSKDSGTLYAVIAGGGVRRMYTGSTLMSEWTAVFTGKQNSFVGITSGDAITTGNSGSGSGDAFDAVTGTVTANTSADLTITYDRGMVASLGGSQNSYVSWSHSDYASDGYVRCYVRRSATPGVTQRVARGYSGGMNIWEIRWQADGQMVLANDAGTWLSSVAGATGLNTIYRIEAHLTTSGGELRVYAGESTTAMTTTPQPGVPAAGPWDSTRFGLMTTSNQTMSVDVAAVAVATSGWIGPA